MKSASIRLASRLAVGVQEKSGQSSLPQKASAPSAILGGWRH